ncbi:hypothetical protein [Lentzea sp. NBRC 102530]|uniref:hypothetical protein n=1 Tax=Lentzea sp. NBRC 102530 TaxID=3032201 RepID=UPI0024A5F7FD|nr:hypothetical protein [Lentzea sp. NBRC 102530]GLY47384.1 hypothetical protein Lesp01_10400 [Lentzea sp. NBRC 102530]
MTSVLARIRPLPGMTRLGGHHFKEATMYAQLVYFDGPRSTELLAAADFAATHRIEPAVASVAGSIRTYVLRRPDGSEVVLTLAETEQDLLAGRDAIMGTSLLPGEDPDLLPGPDRVEIYPVHEVFEHGATS